MCFITNNCFVPLFDFSFPKNEAKREKWRGFANLTEMVNTKRYFLCSRHFEKECFDTSSSMMIRLRQDASPTIEIMREKYVSYYSSILIEIPR